MRAPKNVTRSLWLLLAALLPVVATPQVAQAAPAAPVTVPGLGLDFTNLLGLDFSNILGSLLGGGVFGGGGFGGKATGRFTSSFTNSGGTRSYQGYVPSTYKAGTPMPLVVVLHGCTQGADAIRSLTQFDKLAEADKFIVVYPEQPQSANYLHCWNWFLPTHMQRGSGEPSIIAGITQRVQQRYSIDPKRTFVSGFSAGGAMAAVMGATYPDLFGAVGIGSGLQYGGPYIDPLKAGEQAYRAMGAQARVVPAVVFHGGKDTTVPVADADQLMQQWKTTADWADDGAPNGSIPAAPAATTQAHVASGQAYTLTKYVDGHGRELVQYWLVPEMAHAWSGGCSCAQYSDPGGPDETRAMYDFFAQHPMP
jgi:poly(hydroxyalkanoate) depolymerase family esterase